jgi:hypothetical protein
MTPVSALRSSESDGHGKQVFWSAGMSDGENLFSAVVQKYYDARGAAAAQNVAAPYTITIKDADGHVVFRQKFQEGSPMHGFTFEGVKGRLPVSATITDATGKITPV